MNANAELSAAHGSPERAEARTKGWSVAPDVSRKPDLASQPSRGARPLVRNGKKANGAFTRKLKAYWLGFDFSIQATFHERV